MAGSLIVYHWPNMNWLGHYAMVVDHLALKNVVQGATLGGGSTLHPACWHQKTTYF
jgi:hypothetical protein